MLLEPIVQLRELARDKASKASQTCFEIAPEFFREHNKMDKNSAENLNLSSAW